MVEMLVLFVSDQRIELLGQIVKWHIYLQMLPTLYMLKDFLLTAQGGK
jgi:hypothetical protein